MTSELAEPSRRAALSFMIPGMTSGLRAVCSASRIQRSGVSRGKSEPNSTRLFRNELA